MAYRDRPERETDPDNSGTLFDRLKEHLGLNRDTQLAAWLEVTPGYISKIRHGFLEVNAEIILKIHEKLGWPVERIRFLIREVVEEC